MIDLYGFTLLRNGIKYDYPYRESLRSLCQLCGEVYLALGQSEDGTENTLQEYGNLKIIPTVWDESLRKSGLILSQQTNIALQQLRSDQKSGWGIYLQADEVLNPEDFQQIKDDIAQAEAKGCDSVSFRYLHFWQRYDRVAVSPRWYPQEVRAIRLSSKARSWGDAQGFENCENTYPSDVPVFHYGHVREAQAYELKKWDFGKWWHTDEELASVLKKGLKKEKNDRVVPYLGPHPSFMESRIPQEPGGGTHRDVLIFGKKESLPKEFQKKIHCEKLRWTTDPIAVLRTPPQRVVLLEDLPIWARILSLGRFHSKVPLKMGSPQARPWTWEFRTILKFSEKGITVR